MASTKTQATDPADSTPPEGTPPAAPPAPDSRTHVHVGGGVHVLIGHPTLNGYTPPPRKA